MDLIHGFIILMVTCEGVCYAHAFLVVGAIFIEIATFK